jgi:S-adenosylmethionine:diacylglycerol 3-amino-3-carboxypropyl transferase
MELSGVNIFGKDVVRAVRALASVKRSFLGLCFGIVMMLSDLMEPKIVWVVSMYVNIEHGLIIVCSGGCALLCLLCIIVPRCASL